MRADIQCIQYFIDQMVGIPKFSYPANKQGKRPSGNFCSVKLLEEYPESIPAVYIKSQTDETTTTLTRSLARLRFRIGIVDEDGVASVKILHGWTSEEMKRLMHETGFGFIRCTPASNEDAKLEHTEWEPRQGFSVDVYVERNFEETVDNIQKLIINGEFVPQGMSSINLEEIVVNPYDIDYPN
tara:strand:+ start:1869 stop:2420 length:552 start_codon:yes stop_codon:yes gene_type:complete